MWWRWTWIWFILCGILARYIWVYKTNPKVHIHDEAEQEETSDTKLEIISNYILWLQENMQESPSNAWSYEVLSLLYILEDIGVYYDTSIWQDIHNIVYLPSFAENLLELDQEQRWNIIELLHKVIAHCSPNQSGL